MEFPKPIDGRVSTNDLTTVIKDHFDHQKQLMTPPELSFCPHPYLSSLDLGLIFNVPLVRVNQIKGAPSSVEMERGVKAKRFIKPYHAITARLILDHPEYVPVPAEPSAIEVWWQIKHWVPTPSRREEARRGTNRIGFAPLFGRSYVSSYRMLPPEGEHGKEGLDDSAQSGAPTVIKRLFMLIMEKYGQIARHTLLSFLADNAPARVREEVRQKARTDWLVLMQMPQLIHQYVPQAYQQTVHNDIEARKQSWWRLYMQVLEDEAVSRNLDPEEAICYGKWHHDDEQPVTPQQAWHYPRRQWPITGKGSEEFENLGRRISEVQSSDGAIQATNSSEYHWLLGIQPKSLNQIRNNPHQRLDSPLSILVRYLYRYPEDAGLMLQLPESMATLHEWFSSIDPDYHTNHLGPLFGYGYGMGFRMAKSVEPPAGARRLAAIVTHQRQYGPAIYWDLVRAAEEEAYARGVTVNRLWSEGRWTPLTPTESQFDNEPEASHG